jgi:predicted methyltransferase
MGRPLTHVVAWSQQLLRDVLSAGDFAIDLTAGNGYDTLMLAQAVGPSGRVLAFDLQEQALESSNERLERQGIVVNRLEKPVSSLSSGVSLVQANHAELGLWSNQGPRAIIANLGYFPGGDKELVTKPASTLAALETGCELLAPGGRVAVVVYPGHPGGETEAEAVDRFFAGLDEKQFEVLRLQVVGRPQSPFLLTAGKFN